MTDRPVIFLAFANEKESEARYLRGLAVEQDALRKALEPAVAAGLCELVVESNARVDTILDTFQKARYRDRIAVFHYGGHADGYQLLLESLDGQNIVAHGGGLVSFFSRQKGLKLIFLNGCSTEQQALDLTAAGVPVVIGTSRSINDTIATDLASRFYGSMGQGNAIERAWAEAIDEIKITGGDAPTRAFTWADADDNTVLPDHLPWDVYYAKGAGAVREWNLPRAARNPLFGLELPDSYYRKLPATPFVGLHYFTKDSAALFFGRGPQIRELYNQITGTTPIILLYGKSGVGKSSLLDAGLVPRLEGDYDVLYIRRDQEAGLTGSLSRGLDKLLPTAATGAAASGPPDAHHEVRRLLEQAAQQAGRQPLQLEIARLIHRLEDRGSGAWSGLTDVLKKWRAVESRNERPLIVILDQVEERYTRPTPGATGDELVELLDTVRPLFLDAGGSVRGKLILSYRKEFHPEIRDTFRGMTLPYSELFLKRLDREGIVDAVTGINRHPVTRQKYQLEIEESEAGNLAEIIADDLLEDPGSSIAPVLQIVLGKLWRNATEGQDGPARFTVADYQALKKEGVTMGEFFSQQLAKLRGEHPTYVRSGLALDLLHAHTTDMGTAGSCRQSDLLARYDLAEASVGTLLQSLQDLSLLNRLDAGTTILAHDTLAPVVIREYNGSDAPGQRAARILQNKVSDVGFTLDPAYRAKLVAADVPGAADPQLAKAHTGPDKYRTALRITLGEAYWERDADKLLVQTVYDFRSGRAGISLNDADLEAVEVGAGLAPEVTPGMRRLLPVERQLVELSRQRRARQQRQRRQLRFAAAIAVLLIGATSVWAWFEKQNAEANARSAEANARAAESLYLTSKARVALAEQDPTLAFSIAATAWERTPVNEAVNVLTELMGEERMYYADRMEVPFDAWFTLAVSPNDSSYLVVQHDLPNHIALYSRDWEHRWVMDSTADGYLDFAVPAVFSKSGRFCAVGLQDSVRIYDVNEKRFLRSFAVAHQAGRLAFAPDEEHILVRTGFDPDVRYDTLSVLSLAGTEREVLRISAPADAILESSPAGPSILYFDGTNLIPRPIRESGGLPAGTERTEIPIVSSVPVKYKFSADGRYLLLDSTAGIYVYKNEGGVLKIINHFPIQTGERQLTLSPDGRFLLLSHPDDNDYVCISLQTGSQRSWSLPRNNCSWTNEVFLNQTSPTLLITTTCGNPMRGGDMFANPKPKIYRYDLRWIDHGYDLSERSCADLVFDLEERDSCLRKQIPGLAEATDRYSLVESSNGVKSLIQNQQGQVIQDLRVYEGPETEVLQAYLTPDPPFVIAMTLDVSGNRPEEELLVHPLWAYPWEQGWVYRLTEAETSAYLSGEK